MEHIKRVGWKHSSRMIEIYHLNNVLMSGGCWSTRKTAEMLSRSVGSVSEDLRIAFALRVWPEFDECQNREDALELLKKHKVVEYPIAKWTKEMILEIIETNRGEIK